MPRCASTLCQRRRLRSPFRIRNRRSLSFSRASNDSEVAHVTLFAHGALVWVVSDHPFAIVDGLWRGFDVSSFLDRALETAARRRSRWCGILCATRFRLAGCDVGKPAFSRQQSSSNCVSWPKDRGLPRDVAAVITQLKAAAAARFARNSRLWYV